MKSLIHHPQPVISTHQVDATVSWPPGEITAASMFLQQTGNLTRREGQGTCCQGKPRPGHMSKDGVNIWLIVLISKMEVFV